MVKCDKGKITACGDCVELVTDLKCLLIAIASVIDEEVGELGCKVVNGAMEAVATDDSVIKKVKKHVCKL